MNKYENISLKLAGKKILITGASGFIGKNICETLSHLNKNLSYNIEITGLSRSVFFSSGVRSISQDVVVPFSINECFDFIIHAATPVIKIKESDEKLYDIIVEGTKNALNFAIKCKATHFLLVSSGAVYGEISSETGFIEESQVSTDKLTSAYARGKAVSEKLAVEFARDHDLHLNIARCFAFSGKHLPLDAHFAIGNFVHDALGRRSIQVKGDGSAIRSYMDAEDMVFWLLTILLNENSDIFNVGSDQGISIKDLAYEVASQVGGTDVIIEGKTNATPGNIYVPSIEKAEKLLGLKLSETRISSIKKMIELNRESYERIS